MEEELQALEENQTWELVPHIPDMNNIRTKWVYKVEYNTNNSVERLKACLVAKGLNHQHGVDFYETFSPVVKSATICVVLTLATIRRWQIHQMDVQNAVLIGILQEIVFVS